MSAAHGARARASTNSRPNSRRRSRCSLLFRPKDFLSEWRTDEIATLLDRARARAGVGYPGVFYFACRPRCYLARYAEILTNLPRPSGSSRDSDVTRLLSVTKSS